MNETGISPAPESDWTYKAPSAFSTLEEVKGADRK